MPEYKDTATRLREASKRNDLPTGIVALLSEAYAEIERLQRKCECFHNSNNQENDNGEE